MNFLADESVDRPIVERLRQDGHQVLYVAELGPGMPDDDVRTGWCWFVWQACYPLVRRRSLLWRFRSI